jgi:DNA-binding NarL/FixJ family response regulator
MATTVLIADDQTLVRAGFRMILDAEADIAVVAEATNGVEALEMSRRHHPEIVLMDIRMPVMDGIEATRQLLDGAGAQTRVLVLTTFDEDDYISDALAAGASGFLLKDTPPEQLVEAIRVVAAGDALLSPSVTRRVIAQFAGRASRAMTRPSALGGLTARELEVLQLVARGLSNAEIATELVVSETTVKTHVAHVLAKLRLRDRVQAVVLAYEAGVVHPGDAGGPDR